MTPDNELLKQYATQRDESAFAELVRRHLDHVYSTALRLVNNDSHLAEDMVQCVFADLAKKCGSLKGCVALSGWLHTSTRFAAAKVVRSEQRRRQREQTAFTMSDMTTDSPPEWEQLRPLLDDAIGELTDAERDVVLLRYFEKKSFPEIGTALGLSENGARTRVDRAMEKLRSRLVLRGVTSTTAALSRVLAESVVGTAPSELGARVLSHALAAGMATPAGVGAWLRRFVPTNKLAVVTTAALILVTLAVWLMPKALTTPVPTTTPAVTKITPDAEGPQRSLQAPSRVAEKPGISGSGLRLFFVDDQTSQPITNRVIGLRGWERNALTLVEKQVQLDNGQCVAPFEANTKARFWILTHIEGYADVRLRWVLERGDVIPDFYTVRLVRPVWIGGRVFDPLGNAVAGATVGFNAQELSGANAGPEDRGIDYLTAQTAPDGHWQMNRMAPEIVHRLFGGATHPDYSPSERISVSRQPELERQLRERSLVLHLAPAFIVSGTVADEAGQPIANAQVHAGVLNSSGSRDAQTGPDGNFMIKGCQPGEAVISAEADGFAPTAISLKLEASPPPIRFVLGPGKPLVVRVTDQAGRPIPKATLNLDSFPRSGRAMLGMKPVPQVEFRQKTDQGGLLVWSNAPDQDLSFGVSASGYMNTGVDLKPDGREHRIKLDPALAISGAVRDAVTGELVPRFRLGMGWPEQRSDGSIETHWSAIDRFWATFTGGEFRRSIQEGVVGGKPNPGYVFRFEAEGYAPLVTRVYQADEGEVQLDVQLNPSHDIHAMAYTPEGQVAYNAQVAFITPDNEVTLEPGGFAGPLGHALAAIGKVDPQGWFLVPDEHEIKWVIIVHPSGYAEATLDQLKKDRAVRLGHWASLEGVWQTNGQPVVNAEIVLQWAPSSTARPILDQSAFHTVTDGQGHFAFPQVPSGSLQVEAAPQGKHLADFAWTKLASVEIRPGQAQEVRIEDPLAQAAQ